MNKKLAIIICIAVLAPSIKAQTISRNRTGVATPRWLVGGDAIYTRPTGQFLHNVKQGFGLGGHAVLLADPSGMIGIRGDLAYVRYGQRSQEFRVSSFFGPYTLEQVTNNNIMTIGVGPQIMVPTGSFRPYVNGQVGFSVFTTETNLDGLDPNYYDTNQTNHRNTQLMYGFGGGFNMPFSTGRTDASIDIGAQYHINGTTQYLTRRDIHEDPTTGEVTMTPRESDVRYITFRIGVTAKF